MNIWYASYMNKTKLVIQITLCLIGALVIMASIVFLGGVLIPEDVPFLSVP